MIISVWIFVIWHGDKNNNNNQNNDNNSSSKKANRHNVYVIWNSRYRPNVKCSKRFSYANHVWKLLTVHDVTSFRWGPYAGVRNVSLVPSTLLHSLANWQYEYSHKNDDFAIYSFYLCVFHPLYLYSVFLSFSLSLSISEIPT